MTETIEVKEIEVIAKLERIEINLYKKCRKRHFFLC